MSEKKLSLDEMLQLAEKVENWPAIVNHAAPWGDYVVAYDASVEQVDIFLQKWPLSTYTIVAHCNGIKVGSYSGWNSRLRSLYKRITADRKEKAKQEYNLQRKKAFQQVRGILDS